MIKKISCFAILMTLCFLMIVPSYADGIKHVEGGQAVNIKIDSSDKLQGALIQFENTITKEKYTVPVSNDNEDGDVAGDLTIIPGEYNVSVVEYYGDYVGELNGDVVTIEPGTNSVILEIVDVHKNTLIYRLFDGTGFLFILLIGCGSVLIYMKAKKRIQR